MVHAKNLHTGYLVIILEISGIFGAKNKIISKIVTQCECVHNYAIPFQRHVIIGQIDFTTHKLNLRIFLNTLHLQIIKLPSNLAPGSEPCHVCRHLKIKNWSPLPPIGHPEAVS